MVVVVSLRSQSTVGLVNLAWQDLIAVVAVIKVKGGVYHGGRDAWSTGLKFLALLCACTARSGVCEDVHRQRGRCGRCRDEHLVVVGGDDSCLLGRRCVVRCG